jgi:hypothetical protein
MTTGATPQLGLALPVQGELSGQWGNTVNNGITEYTNIAIAATLTLTGDGAVTLANTTGDASATNITSTLTGAGTVTAQFAIVKVTGTLTTAKVVTGPSYSKTYVVDNAATGGIVTFKASGQTGVSVAVGEKCSVYFNGTDYVKVATSTAGTVTAVSVASANGFAGTSSGGTTPALTLSTSITGVLKGNATAISAATAGTDYLAPPSGTAILKANSGGALANATAGTDYLAPPSGTALLKANSGGALANAVAGTDYVTPTGSETLSNKTLTNPTVTNYVESVVAIGTVTSSSTISLTSGTVQTATLTASTVCTFTMPTATAGKSFILLLKQAAFTGAGTATFTGVKWGTAGAPTVTSTAGAMDIFTFVADGTNWYGSVVQGYTP